MPNLLESAYSRVFGNPAPAPAPVPPTQTAAPAAPAPSPAPAPAPSSPLQKFEKVWETAPTPKPDPNAPKSFLEGISEDNIMKAAKSVAFSNAISDDLRAKIAKGGEEGNAALLEAMNAVSQESYGKAALAGTQITKRAMDEFKAELLKDLPKYIRDNAVQGSTKNKNKVLNDPALKPIVNALEKQFAGQFPDDTPEQIADKVSEYFDGLNEYMNSAKPKPTTKTRTKDGSDDIDWEEFATR